MPACGEWEASFSFVLSPAPDDQWAELFREILLKYKVGTLPAALAWVGHLRGQRFTLFCHPDRLQVYADALKEMVAQANQFRRDKLAASDQLTRRRKDFEALVQSALDSLQL
jgi:hypothetical protein